MENVHLACTEAFEVHLVNSGSSELVGNGAAIFLEF